jgi:hypothetical protein
MHIYNGTYKVAFKESNIIFDLGHIAQGQAAI